MSLLAIQMIRIADIAPMRVILITALAILVLLIMLFPIIMIGSLIGSGIRLIRREGLSIPHLLSIGLGIAYIAYLIAWPIIQGLPKSEFFDFVYSYLSFCFALFVFMFMLYTITNFLNLITNKRKSYRYIIVLGSGLIRGDVVPPLLGNRIDKAIEAQQQNPGSQLIMSGGQGSDETVSEAIAMKRYALSKTTFDSAILVESQSVNTEQNLLFSKRIIDDQGGDPTANILVVTTRYHVLRALLLARQLGIACDCRGAKTKLYFSINAFIREWIAYLNMKRRFFVITLATAFILILLVFIGFSFLDQYIV